MAARRLGVLGPLLNRGSGLSIRDGVLLYKQFIHPVIGYACPVEVLCPHSGEEGAGVAMQASAHCD
jgi:hypothetical protein